MTHIELAPEVALKLMTVANITEGKEFSGFGFVEIRDDVLFVYDAVVLDIGSEVFTEIPTNELIDLMQRPDAKNMKLWLHRHPVGNGVPGTHNWSGTDNGTIKEMPLGGLPKLVKWSCSMVLTPRGWVGRIDNHLKEITQHIEVVPQVREAYVVTDKIRAAKPKPQWSRFSYPYDNWWEEQEEDNEFLDMVRERFSPTMLDDLGTTEEEMADMLADAYYYSDDEMLDAFLDPSVTNSRVINMVKERMVV